MGEIIRSDIFVHGKWLIRFMGDPGLYGTLKVDTKLWKCATASPLPSALVSAASATATQENIDQDWS